MEENKTAETADLSLERLAGLAKIINSFKAAEKSRENINRETVLSACDFDKELDTPAIKTIKAAIPYIDRRYRRELGVMVKLIEIDRLLNGFRETGAMSLEKAGGNMEMLRAIVPNLPKENRQMGETLVKLLEIKSIWDINEEGKGL
ncbi:MAG: hypothetical protein LUC92_01495 [Clostridiales bacterium]|nr:hypothetical protein [Clostridiales bacterium]